MKQSREIVGMPIISITDGREIGKVKNIVINPEQGGIEFLIVQNDEWEFGIKAIPYKLVEGLGDYAVTIESDASVIDLAEIPIANELLSKNIQIKGTRIITKKGRFLGQVTEYYVSEETGKVTGCLIDQNGGQACVIPQDCVLTFGKDIMVVTEDGEKQLVEPEVFLERDSTAGNVENQEENVPTAIESTRIFNENSSAESFESVFEAAESLELTGKTLTSDLYDEQGNLLLAEGETITQDVVDRVKEIGRNKMVELTLKIAD